MSATGRAAARRAVGCALLLAVLVAGATTLPVAPPWPVPGRSQSTLDVEVATLVALRPPDAPGPGPAAPAREAVADAVVAAVPDPATRVVEIHVERALGDGSRPLLRAVVAAVDGRELQREQLERFRPLRLTVPSGSHALELRADGHVPLVVDTQDVPRAGRRLVLQPTSVLCLDVDVAGVVAGVDAEGHAGAIYANAQTDHGDDASWCHPARPLHADLGDPGTPVPFVAGSAFRWQATLVRGTTRVVLEGREPPLQLGERRVLRLDFARVPLQRHRLVGVSDALRRSAELARHWTTDGEPRFEQVRLDANGTCDVTPVAGAEWLVRGGESLPLLAEHVGDEVWLRPERPMVGLGLVDDEGKVVASRAYDRACEIVSSHRPVHVFARDRAVGTRLGAEPERLREVVAADLATMADLVLLHEPDTVAKGTLRVRIGGAPPPDAVRARMKLAVVRRPESARRLDAAPLVDVELPAGSCDVAWSLPGAPDVPIASGCAIAAGAVTEVDATWPRFERWTGEVEGYRDLPRDRAWGRVSWGTGGMFGRGSAVVFTTQGRFEVGLLDGEPLDSTWHLFWSMSAVPARVVSADPVARHLVVAPIEAVRWVRVDSGCEAPWMLSRASVPGAVITVPFATHEGRTALPVAAGQSVHGCLSHGMPGPKQRTVAWWTVGDGVDELTVHPAGGRLLELRPGGARANRGVALVGPHGQWDRGYELTTAESLRVWAPDGTRGVVVFDGNRVRESAREIALGAGDVVAID